MSELKGFHSTKKTCRLRQNHSSLFSTPPQTESTNEYINMTDYSKLKVAELKEELKSRNIPLTGLKVKQNFIDKLLEADATKEASNVSEAVAATSEKAASAPGVRGQAEDRALAATEKEATSQRDEPVELQPAKNSTQTAVNESDPLVEVKDDQNKENDMVSEEAQAFPAVGSEGITVEPALAATPSEDRDSEPYRQPTATSSNSSGSLAAQPGDQPASCLISDPVDTSQPQPAQTTYTDTPFSDQVPPVKILEDSRKRKRRSITPPPSTIEVLQKRAKASDGSPRAIQQDGSLLVEVSQASQDIDVTTNGHELQERALEESPRPEGGCRLSEQVEAKEPQQEVRRSSRSRSPIIRALSQQEGERSLEPTREEPDSPLGSPIRSKPRSPALSKRHAPSPPQPLATEDRHVSPALHPASCSLYIRNFKRPLHIPSLRSHLSAIAASPNADDDKDPIKTFYLDSIRTHGFVSFISITAASRARSALHDARFPDEKTREPLWVDFVADEKVEEWIETEQRANSGGRIGRRWEVVYQDSLSGGIEALLQEVGSGSGSRMEAQRRPSSLVERRESEIAIDTTTVPGLHPDRARLVPSEDDVPQRKKSILQQEARPEQTGTGFRALDDLFPSTTAKPKLYYKPVDAHVTEERLDMIKDLSKLAGAKSGDPDMKRYSFELERGREEWVDKGPEFGFGGRGRGFDRGGRGGYRGRGGIGRGNDSWRSGGRH